MTMFAFFAFNAIFELMYHFKVPALPPQLEYVTAIMAYGVEGLLFLWHLEGRPPMDVQVCCGVVHYRQCDQMDSLIKAVGSSVTRLGDLLDFGQLFKAFGNN